MTPTKKLAMITAKIKSRCAETGMMIPRGELCFIDRDTREVYSLDSLAGRDAQYGYSEEQEEDEL